jgi:4-hydroxybenzoate polyprenyltransferase
MSEDIKFKNVKTANTKYDTKKHYILIFVNIILAFIIGLIYYLNFHKISIFLFGFFINAAIINYLIKINRKSFKRIAEGSLEIQFFMIIMLGLIVSAIVDIAT